MMRFSSSTWCGLFVCILCWLPVAVEGARRPALSRKQTQTLDAVTLAYFQGNTAAVLKLAGELVTGANEAALETLNGSLDERQLPTAAKLLAQARAGLVLQGFQDQLPRLGTQEALLVLPELQGLVESTFEAAAASPVMDVGQPAPTEFDVFEQLLWEAHVLGSQLENAHAVAQYLGQAIARLPRQAVAKLEEPERQLLQVNTAGLIERVEQLQRELDRRENQLRYQRLTRSRDVLAEPGMTADKFHAAYTWAIDAELLTQSLTLNRQPRGQGKPVDDELREQVAELAEQAAELAGDLTVKSRLLLHGLHWWMRGRYGLGPEVFGLAKSPAALHSPQAQMALFMPSSTPEPMDPRKVDASTAPVPHFDRRHHYWWAWEDRRVNRSAHSEQLGTSTELLGVDVTQPGDRTYFW